MISWRWPRPIGVIESIALMPVAIGSCTDWRTITPGAWSSRARRSSDSMSPRPSMGVPSGSMTRPMKLSPTGTERISPVRRTVWPSSMPVEVTEDDDADLAGVEVQRDAQRAVLELQQLVGHRRGQAGDARDAVTGGRDGADLLLAGRRRLVVVDVLLERVADLLRTDRQLRHVPCLFPWWSSPVSCRVCGASAGEPAAGVVEPADDGAVDDVVADLDPQAADQLGSTTTCSWTALSYCVAERRGQPLLLVGGQLAGGVHGGDRLLERLGGEVEVLLQRARRRCRAPG